uniref:Uncharacterized protein n=1 Tax=Paramoeba aestuarina TaxID=180227 RepID=A0A7S4JG79_9EUKA|mmetsp:Transcript_10093/g.15247  ORF Transcript_10093/g.15247 Transcript_10093/m.15247 type:complete len:236 (+) Transcript_10093:188-895(+)
MDDGPFLPGFQALPVALFCLASFYCQNFSAKLDVPVAVSNPKLATYFGRYCYLTATTNLFGCFYYTAYLVTFFWRDDDNLLLYVLARLFPLMFALGVFVTVAYYVLDHFVAERVTERKRYVKNGYPHLGIARHLEHMFGAAAVCAHAWTFGDYIGDQLVEQCIAGAFTTIVIFFAYYVSLTHLNYQLVNQWPYPVIDLVQRKGGMIGVVAFEMILMGVVMGLAKGGLLLLELGRQ